MNKKKRIFKNYAILGMIAASICVAAESAYGGIAVSPMQQWVTVKPGQEGAFMVAVSNTLREPQNSSQAITVEAVDFEISPEGGISFGEEFSHPRSAVKLISLAGEDKKFVLEPGQTRQIKGKVSVPLNADGDYWGAILVKIVNPQKDAKGVMVNLQTASGIFIHVPRTGSVEKGSVTRTDILMPDFSGAADANQNLDESEKSGLRVSAELKNDGVVTFLGEGKAYLYTGRMKRFGAIPMHAARRQIFPGQSRIFTGILSEAVSAGTYRMRIVFSAVAQNSEDNTGRMFTKDLDFTITPRTSEQWRSKTESQKPEKLKIETKEIKLTATPGRYTTVSVLVENIGISTVTVKSHFDQAGIKNWFSTNSDVTTFGPNMKRNIVFSLTIPKDVEPGEYSGNLMLDTQRSGTRADGNSEIVKIPIAIKIT